MGAGIDVAGNWQRVRERVVRAAEAAGRDPASVCIVAAAKAQPLEAIERAIAAGATDVGENYVQDAAAKIPHIAATVRWHMIGHLQRNKAGRAVQLFDVIHSVDSVALGEALARSGERCRRVVRVLVEVNVGGEGSKRGVTPEQAEPLVAALATQPWLVVDGLMAVPPPSDTPEAVRPYFRSLRALRERLGAGAPANAPLRELSMGMTDDFEVAIAEGATMVRIGRGIFGERRQ
jgi:pyridoxal phosphate enzyme (YggS family)